MAYLSEFHPEIFGMPPRPGGLAKIPRSKLRRVSSKHSSSKNIAERSSKSSVGRSTGKRSSKVTVKTGATSTTTESRFMASFRSAATASAKQRTTTREYRIKKILSSSPWLLFEDEEESDNPLPPDPVHDAMVILSTTISTIMLMAAGHSEIPREHLLWALSYLECVKDDYGFYPPNVRGMMNNIRKIDASLTSYLEDDLDEDQKSDITGLVIKGPTTPSALTAPAANEAVASVN